MKIKLIGIFKQMFMIEYLAFVGIVMTKDIQNAQSDRKGIQALKKNTDINRIYVQLIQNKKQLNNSWEIIINELQYSALGSFNLSRDEVIEGVWWNCSHEFSQNKTNEEKNKEMGKIHSLNDWENMIEFIYTIRNNLFHGSKGPNIKRDKKSQK
jgi:hypothetical protein